MLTPGFLHLDVRSGLRVELLNAALFELHHDQECIIDALKSLNFRDISITKKATRLLDINASLEDGLLLPGPLLEIRELFASKKVDKAISSLAIPILDNLKGNEKPYLTKQDAIWLLRELTALCAQVAKLDPKFITASKPRLGEQAKTGGRNDGLWLNQILVGIPMISVSENITADILAAAFLKTLVGQWGARGEHTILKVGIGQDDAQHVEALWCEASLPESMNECGPGNEARMRSLYEISGLLPTNIDIGQLCTSLSLHGATSCCWYLVHSEKQSTFYQMKFFCTDEDKRDVIEAFLIKGEASQVVVRVVERHELNRRQICIPMGTGNKTSSIRFWEYIYYGKIVRVEPLKEDLDQYIIKTDYSADVARSDTLLAWKKWRNRSAEDK